MFVTGPDVIRAVTHEEVTKEQLGGAMTHNERSGVAHFAVDNDRDCLSLIRELLSYLPGNNVDAPPRVEAVEPPPGAGEELDQLVPYVPQQPYDMLDVITRIVDADSFLESARALRAQHHRRARADRRTGGRHRGESAGAPRWRPRHRCLGEGGALRALLRCLQHSARHVRGRARASFRARRRSSAASSVTAPSCCIAFAEATVPKLTVITRKAYGGAYCVMSSKHLRTDVNLAWPSGRDRRHGCRGRGQHSLSPRD